MLQEVTHAILNRFVRSPQYAALVEEDEQAQDQIRAEAAGAIERATADHARQIPGLKSRRDAAIAARVKLEQAVIEAQDVVRAIDREITTLGAELRATRSTALARIGGTAATILINEVRTWADRARQRANSLSVWTPAGDTATTMAAYLAVIRRCDQLLVSGASHAEIRAELRALVAGVPAIENVPPPDVADPPRAAGRGGRRK